MTQTLLPLLLAAVTTGLLGLPHCVAMCGGLAGAVPGGSLARAGWHLGRLSTYGMLGAAAGATGAALPGPPWVVTVLAATLLVWFAARIAGIAPAGSALPAGLHRLAARLPRSGPLAPIGFGLLSGLLPCGLVYAALAMPVAAGSAAAGAALMVVFGLGTLPALAIAVGAMHRLTRSRPWARRLLAAGVLAAGLAALAHRLPAADAAAPPECHEEP